MNTRVDIRGNLVDECEEALERAADDESRLDALLDLARALVWANPVRGAEVAKQAIQLARVCLAPRKEAQGHYELARNELCKDDFVAATGSASLAIEQFRALNDDHGAALAAVVVANTFTNLGMLDRALEIYESSLGVLVRCEDLVNQAKTLSNIGATEFRMGNTSAAIGYFQATVQLVAKHAPDSQDHIRNLNNYACALAERARKMHVANRAEPPSTQLDVALECIEDAIERARKTGMAMLEFVCMATLADVLEASGCRAQAIHAATELVAAASAQGYQRQEMDGRIFLARINLAQGNLVEARLHAELAHQFFQKQHMSGDLIRIYELLSSICEQSGEIESAFKYLRLSVEARAASVTEDSESKARALALASKMKQATLETNHFRALAYTDPLTGLPNRRFADETLAGFIEQKHAAGQSVCLVLADIDHFKSINDDFSHLAGDAVIRQVARIFQQHCRTTDVAVRYGGEEFLFVFAGLRLPEAASVCERIRSSIETFEWSSIEAELKVTASFGVASCDADTKIGDAIARADEQLYRAKRGGRNRIAS